MLAVAAGLADGDGADADGAPGGQSGRRPEPGAGGAAEQRALQPLRSTGDAEGRPVGKALLYILIASVMGAGAGLGRWVLREKLT